MITLSPSGPAVSLSAVAHAVTSAQPANHYPAADVEILVNGTPQKRYAHDGRWYIEAVKGREYAIRLRNPYPVRLAVALAVDGLNTIDARHTAAANARKWVIEPYQNITIACGRRAHERALRFTTGAFVRQALGETANLGSSRRLLKERVRPSSRVRKRLTIVRAPAAAAPAARAGQSVADADSLRKLDEQEHAATGMGQRTDHAVTEVRMDLEETPAETVNIRYEYRRQLVRLGILPGTPIPDPLQRRERARGFEPGFSPEVPRN